jgi:hypothetical protein
MRSFLPNFLVRGCVVSCRFALTAAIALWGIVPVAFAVDQAAIARAARDGIGVLSPVQSLPITLRQDAIPEALPCNVPPEGEDPPMLLEPFEFECLSSIATSEPSAPVQPYSFTLDEQDAALVVIVSRGAASMNPWFSTVGSQQGFAYSGGRWVYRDDVGPSVALGNLTSNAPLWGNTVPIGGLQLSSGWSGTSDRLKQGDFAYSSSVGRLNYTDTSATSGAIDYGVTASSGSLRYGVTPDLTLESQFQGAPALATRGIGSTFSAGEFGTFRVGATNSHFHQSTAWRYRFGYNVNLTEDVSLAVTNEQVEAGFGDLSTYRSGLNSAPLMKNALAAGIPVSGGTLMGTYTGTREHGIAVEQRFGVEHSRLIAPQVRLAVGGNRDVLSGDYEVRAGVSMPVEAFLKGSWLYLD